MKFVSVAFVLSLLLGFVSANFGGAGQCLTGVASPSHGASSSGSLSTGGYTIQVDGQTVTNAATVTAGETFIVTITGSTTFKGFLVYIPGEDSAAITSPGVDGHLAGSCSGKAAATHLDANVPKNSVAVKADIDSAKMTTLELNIVVQYNTYYYTQIALTVEGGSGPTPAASPVAQPTACEPARGLFLFGTKGC